MYVHMYPRCRSIVYGVVDEIYLSFVQAKDVSVLKVFLAESLDTGGCIQYCNSWKGRERHIRNIYSLCEYCLFIEEKMHAYSHIGMQTGWYEVQTSWYETQTG